MLHQLSTHHRDVLDDRQKKRQSGATTDASDSPRRASQLGRTAALKNFQFMNSTLTGAGTGASGPTGASAPVA
jgi:hypothetical protein